MTDNVGLRTSGNASSMPVMRMIRSSEGRAAVNLSERPARRAKPVIQSLGLVEGARKSVEDEVPFFVG